MAFENADLLIEMGQPDADLRPRREVWGGLWCALLGATAYVGCLRRDRLAWRLAVWGVLGGAIGAAYNGTLSPLAGGFAVLCLTAFLVMIWVEMNR